MAIMVALLAASLAYLMLGAQESAIDRTELTARGAEAMASARAAIDRAATSMLNASGADLGAADDAGALPPLLDLVGRAGVKVSVYDEQGKLNLNNVVEKDKPNALDIKKFIGLLGILNLPQELADTLTDWIDPDSGRRLPSGAEDEYYLGLTPPRLPGNHPLIEPAEAAMVKGFDDEAMARLLPFVTALPDHVRLSVNSASPEALAATIAGLGLEKARAMTEARKANPFASLADFRGRLPQGAAGLREEEITIESEYFLITAETERGGAWVNEQALVHLDRANKKVYTIWRRST